MMGSVFTLRRLALPLVALLAAGCDDLGLDSGDDARVSLSMAVPGSQAGSGASALLVADPITSGGHTLDLQQVQVTFSEAVLERSESGVGGDSDGDSEMDSDSDNQANRKFRVSGTTVDLPLTGGVVTPFSETLPSGSYEELELDVRQVRLVGTYDGQAFDVIVPVDAEVEMDFSPAFVVDSEDDRLNLTITIDALRWLRNADGTLVDPRLLAADEDLRERIADRIEDSFDAFEDSDKDADEADSDSDSDGDTDGDDD